MALAFANRFEDENARDGTDKRVCVLERGQWWLSHEVNYTPKASRKGHPNLREFLEDNGRPYHFLAHPDSVTGILELLSTNRSLSKAGLYDYKVLGNIHTIAQCLSAKIDAQRHKRDVITGGLFRLKPR